jgi:YVTN family beta-propeller protein
VSHRGLRRGATVMAAVLLLAPSCGSSADPDAGSDPSVTATVPSAPSAEETAPVSATPTTGAPPPPTTVAPGRGAMGRYPERVYVPNTKSDTVQVVDPVACQVVDEYAVGHVPHHIAPSWDLSELYVFNTESDSLTAIDPTTGRPVRDIPVEDPYNLYFTPDGAEAVVVAERYKRLDFRDPHTWELHASVSVDPPGVDHLAFSRSGDYLVASTEFSGFVVKVDIAAKAVTGMLDVGGAPIDVVRDPDDDRIMYVANQALHGVHVIDADAMTELAFIPAGKGTHGLLLSRDKTKIYASNRLEGTISVIDLATRTVVDTWETGGSPDMGLLDPAGTTMWIANRYHSSIMAIDVTTGAVRCTIPTGSGPHGLTYFPTPGVHSIGHNGLMIDEEGNIE